MRHPATPTATGSRLAGVVGALLLAVHVLGGCGQSTRTRIRPERDLFDPNPAQRTEAVREVRRARDREWVPALIEMLDDEDPGVRLVASATLADLTGREVDYRPWAPPEVRRQAVRDWRAWWAAQSPARAPEGRSP